MRRPLALLAAIAAPACLGGCDLAIAGPFMPPILPGVGFPLTGVVLDANTHLPIGGATVQSGLGSTITDGNGRFNLYGGLGSREVSCSRAGYTAVTDGDVDPNASGDLQFQLQPVYDNEQTLATRFLELSGGVAGLPANTPALVSFAGTTANVSNQLYQLDFRAEVPGKAFSAVLAYGITNKPVTQATQDFYFTSFFYTVTNYYMGENVPDGKATQNIDFAGTSQTIAPTSVKYSNLPPGNNVTVQTDILLDFGVLGSVPVARAFGSNQQVPVPTVNNLKYDIVGKATSADGNGTSTVQLTTNNPAQATFQLLSIPKISSPANNATSAGSRPTFSWTPVPQDVLYQITLTEVGEGTKWVGRTRHSEIQYPAFSPGDINGGALRSDKKYTWTLDVLDALGPTDLPTSKADPVPAKPYRIRQRQATVSGYGFAP